MMKTLRALCWIALALLALPARAQWITQTLQLKAGWNAVFLHVDANHATLDQLVGPGAPVLTPIEQVWRWNANPATAQFIDSPQEPVNSGTQWTSWRRSDGGSSALQFLTANSAYLVYSTADHTWQLKGRPVIPRYEWSTSGLNLFGFPTVSPGAPNFEDFLAPAPALLTGEIFRYTGGEFGTGNPGRVFALRTTPVERGEAFWIRAGEVYNHYYGPFEVTATSSGRIAFGDSLSVSSFRLRNLTAEPLTVTLRLKASEAPPPGQVPIAAVPPLLVRGEINPVNLTHDVSELPVGATRSWTLEPAGLPGSEAEVVLGLDRAVIAALPGSLLAGNLELTDSLGQTRVDIGVSAGIASRAGLWVGEAAVTEVGQYLQQYLRDAGNRLVVNTNGNYVVTGVITNLTPVPTAYPLRLIVHNPATGPATLLQRVYFGVNVATNPVVATGQGALDPNRLADARRISATHLPWSEDNAGWAMSGQLSQGVVLTTSVTNRFDQHESNPFLHTYHPDHDNLNPTFRSELPQGSESYTIIREIVLNVTPPGTDFESRVQAGLSLVGDYLETLRVQGLARAGNTFDTRRFDVRGVFKISRVSEVPVLTRVP